MALQRLERVAAAREETLTLLLVLLGRMHQVARSLGVPAEPHLIASLDGETLRRQVREYAQVLRSFGIPAEDALREIRDLARTALGASGQDAPVLQGQLLNWVLDGYFEPNGAGSR